MSEDTRRIKQWILLFYFIVTCTIFQVYLTLSRRGARVLALGIRELGTFSLTEIKDFKRETIEAKLRQETVPLLNYFFTLRNHLLKLIFQINRFAGFVIISCPLKSDSKAMIKELLSASHHVSLINLDSRLGCSTNRILFVLACHDYWRQSFNSLSRRTRA